MTTLFLGKSPAARSFLEKLTIAFAPADEVVRKARLDARLQEDASFEDAEETLKDDLDHEGKPMIILTRSAKHLGSI